MKKIEIPVTEKFCLTIEEAAAYFGIGKEKIRKLISSNPNADYLLKNGRKTVIPVKPSAIKTKQPGSKTRLRHHIMFYSCHQFSRIKKSAIFTISIPLSLPAASLS